MRGIIVKLPPWVSAEIEAVAAMTGCGRNHLARMIRNRVTLFFTAEIKGKVMQMYRDSIAQREIETGEE